MHLNETCGCVYFVALRLPLNQNCADVLNKVCPPSGFVWVFKWVVHDDKVSFYLRQENCVNPLQRQLFQIADV